MRLLTEIIYAGNKGMNPTRAFIDATLKYKTLLGDTPDAPNHFLYDTQANVLDFVFDGNEFPSEFTPGKQRNGLKSIECQIMDWADDTAYSLNDLTDGIRAGFLNRKQIEDWAEGQTLDSYGVKIIGISDISGAIWCDSGINPVKLRKHAAKTGSIVGFKNTESIDPAALLCQPCDILAPCALDRAITAENAPNLRCRTR